MSRCHQAAGLFAAYWDDEATAAERGWLESHLKTCTRCHHEYEQYGRTLTMVSGLPRHEARPDFTERVVLAARAATPVADQIRVLPRREMRWAPAAAAAALLLVAAISVLNGRGARDGRGVVASTRVPTAVPGLIVVQQELLSDPASGDAVAAARITGKAAIVTESLFDHAADVEFMLEPVQLQRGRTHTGSRLPDGVQGNPVVITF